MIGIIVAVHSIYPDKLIRSIDAAEEAVNIYLFFHGNDRKLQQDVIALARSRQDVTFFNYAINRGLSRSWNEGIHISRQNGDELAMILNDDLHFVDGGFARFVAFARSVDGRYGIITANGLETGQSPIAGHVLPQDFACCIVGPAAITEIGYLDTHFSPAYFEDMDYKRRMALADLPILISEGTLVEHERSSTGRASKELARSFDENFIRNRDYYALKWGGQPGCETFSQPFNDPARPLSIQFEEYLPLS